MEQVASATTMEEVKPAPGVTTVDDIKAIYRERMKTYVAMSDHPPTQYELKSKHDELASDLLKSPTRSVGQTRHQIENELRDIYEEFVRHNRLHRQTTLLRSALGDSLFNAENQPLAITDGK